MKTGLCLTKFNSNIKLRVGVACAQMVCALASPIRSISD
jgi:hypothetical protein